MKLSKEIEARFLEVDVGNLIKKLFKFGAKDEGALVLKEIIFCDLDRARLSENRFVKLRTSGGATTVTYKHRKNQSISGTYELEFTVSDGEKMVRFLEEMRVVACRYQEKRRHTFRLDDVTVDIDAWPNIPPYVELEGPSEISIKRCARKLGLDWAQAVFENPKHILEKKYAIPLEKLRWFTFSKQE